MELASLPDLSLAECLGILRKHFDLEEIVGRTINADAVLEYYRQSDRGYRLFHSRAGALHVALNRDQATTANDYLGQVQLIAERLEFAPAKTILEIGCGTGFNTNYLARHFAECQFVGVDLSTDHVEWARRGARGLQNIRFEQGDFHQLRFGAETFDALFAVECLCQGTDWRAAIREAYRVLRVGGQVAVVDAFRRRPIAGCGTDIRLATWLIEKTMAVEEFAVLEEWLTVAEQIGFAIREELDLTEAISHNLARFYSLSRRYFKMPFAARALAQAFPPRLIENAIAGLLMPFTVASGVHGYYLVLLEKH